VLGNRNDLNQLIYKSQFKSPRVTYDVDLSLSLILIEINF